MLIEAIPETVLDPEAQYISATVGNFKIFPYDV